MFRKSIPTLCLVVGLLLTLSSCSAGIADPIENVSSDVEPWAPVLSEEEAAALFGVSSSKDAGQFQGAYFYYIAPISAKSKQQTLFRYNVETSIAEYVCADPICTHRSDSSCPFASITDGAQGFCVVGDWVVYAGDSGADIGLECYHRKTGEHKILLQGSFVEDILCLGDTVYCTTVDFAVDPLDHTKFLRRFWKIDDLHRGTAALLTEEDGNIVARYEKQLFGGEEMTVGYFMLDPEGKLTGGPGDCCLYKVDGETGERTLLNDRRILGIKSAGRKYLYFSIDSSSSLWREKLCLTDAVTGETVVLADYAECENDVNTEALTDRCAFWVKKDPEDPGRMILYCYDYINGEKKEYPLEGRWTNGLMTYYRGRLYLTDAENVDRTVSDPNDPFAHILDSSKLVIWDILSGKQQVLRDGAFADA